MTEATPPLQNLQRPSAARAVPAGGRAAPPDKQTRRAPATRRGRLPSPLALAYGAIVVAVAVALFFVAYHRFVDHIEVVPFHRDEARWVGRAFLFDEAIENPLGETWEPSLLTEGQPPLGSYLMGIGLTLQGHDTTTTTNRQLYDFHHNDQWNRIRGRIPSQQDLDAGRRTNSVVGALTAVTLFLIGQRLTGLVGGVAASLFFIFHPLATMLSAWAGSDALLALLVALAALVAVLLGQRPSWWNAILLGVVLGLGGATKLSPLVVAGGMGALGVALLVAGRPWARKDAYAERQQDFGLLLVTVPFVAFGTFVAVYPYLWPDPIGRTLRLFSFRAEEMDAQGDIPTEGIPGWDSIAVDGGLPDAISRTWFWLGKTMTTSDWLSGQVTARWGWHWDVPWLDLGLGALGLGLLTVLTLMDGPLNRYGMALAVIAGQIAVTWIGMRADFDRYQLPIVVATAVGVAITFGMAAKAIVSVVRWAVARLGLTRPPEAGTVRPSVPAGPPAS